MNMYNTELIANAVYLSMALIREVLYWSSNTYTIWHIT